MIEIVRQAETPNAPYLERGNDTPEALVIVLSFRTSPFMQEALREAALSEIRGLRDRIPICASCRKVRDDDGF